VPAVSVVVSTEVELQLLCPEDEFVTYLQLLVNDLCLGRSVCAFAPLATAGGLLDHPGTLARGVRLNDVE
jgi:hypothetical protein